MLQRPVCTGLRGRVASGVGFLRLAACLLFLSAAVAAPAGAISLAIGGTPDHPDDATFIPFGGLTLELRNAINAAVSLGEPLPVPRSQQVYDASSFGVVPIDIFEISFVETVSQIGNAGLLGGTSCSEGRSECGLFTLRLSTTTTPVNGLAVPVDPYDPTAPDAGAYDTNLNPIMTAVFATQILLSDISSGGVLTFTGSPFRYDPLVDGNLILDFQITDFGTSSDITQGLSTLDFAATDEAGFPSEAPPYSTADNFNGQDNNSFGLVTTFEIAAAPVPEPGTGTLLGLGLAGLALLGRRSS